MAVITIREQSQTDIGFNATLVIDGNNYSITVSDPFEEKQEQELEWYFEEWLRYPILDNVKAERAKASVRNYGKELFKQVFQADIKAYAKYSQLCSDLTQVQLEIESITPEFHAIHWEALQDPDLPRPFAIDSVLIRKSIQPATIAANVKESPIVNLLVVTARPNAEQDVGYRTISRPLVEAIRNAKLRVNIELLRPGTYEALSRHLEAKGNGYYHIVHFDVHGALKTYEDFQQGVENNRYLYDARYGRDKEIKPYDGLKAYLALEGNAKGEYDLVEASEIANLLTGKGIPVCILNACQSGKQLRSPLAPLKKGGIEEDNRETSLGSRLMNAGMQMVVAMSYSVTVTAAEIVMREIYTHLFDNQDLNEAIRLGRRELYNRKQRTAYYNTEIELEDWLLPVTYCNGEIDFNLREFTPEEEEQYYLSLDRKYEFPQPTYGFVGRDIDILSIEKALLQHNILLLQGMGGTGKTTLLNYLRKWWQITNFAQDIFYFGYDKKAYTLQQIVYEIGKQVYNRFEFGTFQAQNLTVQWRKLSKKLRAEFYILILDNLESVTGQPLAIQNTLDEVAREEIKKFLASLVGGNTKVVLGSRIAEQWLESTFRDNCYRLQGLDIQASTDLAENILERVNSNKSLAEIKTDEHFQKLMKLLAGYPLAMEVILANLKNQSPKYILEQLEKAEIDPGGDDKTNNIIKCIEYSYSNLSESAQQLLLLLAPFKGFIFTLYIDFYKEELSKLKSFQNYKIDRINKTIAEAINFGLLSNIEKDYPSELLSISPLLSYFLKNKLKEADKQTKQSLLEAFKNYYLEAARSYTYLLKSKKAQDKLFGQQFVKWEYENLYQALQICLKRQERFFDIWDCLFSYLKITNNHVEKLQLTENVYNELLQYKNNQPYPEKNRDIVAILGNLANCYRSNRQYQKAKDIYQNSLYLISRIEDLDYKNKQQDIAIAYHQLGLISKNTKEYFEAKEYYRKAIEIYNEINEEFEKADTYSELATVNQKLKDYEQARHNYQQALDIFIEYKDRRHQAMTYHNLGSLEHELKKFKQAHYYYEQALIIKIQFVDSLNIANTLNSLGNLFQELQEFEKAKYYYQMILDIAIKCTSLFYQAIAYHNLGSVERELGEYLQAKEYLQQALNLKIELKDYFSQAITYHELGRTLQKLSEFERAKSFYFQALGIFSKSEDRQSLGLVFRNLASLYQKTEDDSLLKEVAVMFEMTEAQVKDRFDWFNDRES